MDANVHPVSDSGRFLLAHRGIGMIEGILHLKVLGRNSRHDLAFVIEPDPVGGNPEVLLAGNAMGNSLLGLVQCFEFPPFPSDLLEMLKVAGCNWRDVFSTEDSHFKVVWLFQPVLLCNLRTSPLQVIQGLIDDSLSANVLGDAFRVSIMRNQLLRRCKVDSVNMGVSVVVRRDLADEKMLTYWMAGAQLAK